MSVDLTAPCSSCHSTTKNHYEIVVDAVSGDLDGKIKVGDRLVVHHKPRVKNEVMYFSGKKLKVGTYYARHVATHKIDRTKPKTTITQNTKGRAA